MKEIQNCFICVLLELNLRYYSGIILLRTCEVQVPSVGIITLHSCTKVEEILTLSPIIPNSNSDYSD